jgi:hypothetical protein
MNQLQTRVLIERDLDVIKPDEVVSSDKKILTYIENKNGIEKIMRGYQVIAYLDNEEIKNCMKYKNGEDGWVEFIDEKMKIKRKEGDVKAYLCLQFDQGQKAPRVDISISDMQI